MSSLPLKCPKMDEISTSICLLDIPDEILEIIFLKLPVYDVQWNLALVCKRFLKISRYPNMVKELTLTLRNMTCEEEMSKCLTKAKSALVCHPNLMLTLEYEDNESDVLLMKEFKPFVPFVKKLVKLVNHETDLALDM